MKALIDLDILCYELGGEFEDNDGKTITDPADPAVMQRVHGKIGSILRTTSADSWEGFITESRSNFRIKVATLRPYKGKRQPDKPPFYYVIRGTLIGYPNVTVVRGQEADDALGIYQAKNGLLPPDECETIICSRDKDLRMIPGWHFGWNMGNQKQFGPEYISELEGLKLFYIQMLIGDPVDNIPGLYGVGPKSAYAKRVKQATSEVEMFNIVSTEYKCRFDSEWERFYDENYELLWIRRESA